MFTRMLRRVARVDDEDIPPLPASPYPLSVRSLLLSGRPYRGTSLIRNSPPPYGHRRALGIVLLWGAKVGLFLMSGVPLHPPPPRVYRD